MISIDQGRLDELVRECINETLSPEEVRRIARAEIREKLGVFTLKEACRWLKWRSPASLKRALKRHGIDVIKTDYKKSTYALPDLIAFREAHRIHQRPRFRKAA